MTFQLPPLPYDKKALEPYISEQTLELHHGKHHQAYINKANDMIKGTDLEDADIETAVVKSYMQGNNALFNNIGQSYNHAMFWQSMSPSNDEKEIPAILEAKIEEEFGSIEKFKEAFKSTGMSQFGSGWVWLTINSSAELEIIKTSNAETPLIMGRLPLLTCDVWEHAYYLDYQNKRADFLDVFVNKLANWEFATDQYTKAIQMISSGTCGCGTGCGCSTEKKDENCGCGTGCDCG